MAESLLKADFREIGFDGQGDLAAAAFLGLVVFLSVTEAMLHRSREAVVEASLGGIEVGHAIAAKEVGKESLGEILGIFGGMAALSH